MYSGVVKLSVNRCTEEAISAVGSHLTRLIV